MKRQSDFNEKGQIQLKQMIGIALFPKFVKIGLIKSTNI